MDCCDICGDVGVAETLTTCCQCKINCEHMYCMKNPIQDHVNSWRCEECENNSKQKPAVSSCLTSEIRKRSGYGSWEKKVQTGKTKYISAREAIMLSSGETKSLAAARHSRNPRPRTGMKLSERTLTKPRNVPQGISHKEHLTQPKLQRRVDVEIPGRNRQKFKKLEELRRSNLQHSQAHTNRHAQDEPAAEVQSPQTKARRLMKLSSCARSSPNSSPFTMSGGTGNIGIKTSTSNNEIVNNNLSPELHEYSCSPALDALWKGNFSIQDDDNRHGELNHRLQAHPPSKVPRKIYEISKQLPDVLRFQLVPLKELWINLFKDYIPDKYDIGLYFFPSVGERSEDYNSLLESISVKNLALRIQIADVELLVFTSRLLHPNSQYWQGQNFLWGVFHRLKRDTTVQSNNKGLMLSSVQPSEDGEQVVDMDIDMMCGIHVGKMDIRVNRAPVREKRVRFKEDSVTTNNRSITRRVFDPTVTVKMETEDLVPPGFEEAYRLRVLEDFAVGGGGGE